MGKQGIKAVILKKHVRDCTRSIDVGSPWNQFAQRVFFNGSRSTPKAVKGGDRAWTVYCCLDPMCTAEIAVLNESVLNMVASK
jgi:hypothetical protein